MAVLTASLLALLFAAGRMQPMFSAFHNLLLILFVPIICLLICALLLFRGSRLARYALAFMFGVKAMSLFGISAFDFATKGTPAPVLAPPLLLAAALLCLTAMLLFSRRLGSELSSARKKVAARHGSNRARRLVAPGMPHPTL
jgi:hypothetical protein